MKPPLTHNHLARPLVTASHDIEALGEVHRCTLFGTHADHLNELASDGIDIENGVTAACREDDMAFGTLRRRACRSGLNALWQVIVGRW